MRVLLTGCAGFIGSAVAQELARAGHEVAGVDDLNDAYDARLKAWRLDQLRDRPSFTFHKVDILDRKALASVFEASRPEIVLNLAARAGVRESLVDPWVYVDSNVTGTLNLLELSRIHDVQRFLLSSTSSLYGAHNPRPFSEEANTDRPFSPYAATKKGAEALVAAYSHLYGFHAPVVRYFTVYGPAGRPDMSVFRFVRNISEGRPILLYGDGSQQRDFSYVADVARGTVFAAERVKGFEVINLGSDRPVTLARLIEIIEKRVGKPATFDRRPMPRADVPATWADITKARKLLGWEPRVSLDEGIDACVAWYDSNRSWAKGIELGEA